MPVEWLKCAWCPNLDGPWVPVTDVQAQGVRITTLCEDCYATSEYAPKPKAEKK